MLAELGFGDNPTLTADLLDIYFTTNRDGESTDVWQAHRSAPTAPFGAPIPVPGISTGGFETSSSISADGLTLWVASDRPGGLGDLDVWMFNRPDRAAAWSPPVNLLSLNSAAKDVPRPPGYRGLVMPSASERDSPNLYRTFLAARSDATAPFGAPHAIPELTFADRSTVDAFLSDDGLTMFFCSAPPPNGPGDLYVAWRRSLSEPFAVSVPLDDLNTPGDDRDPWLSPDGTLLFFSSDRGGIFLSIYAARVRRAPPAAPP